MIQRTIQDKLAHIAKKMPVITINGPRQSGKTTLAKHLFPHHTYINLELPADRELATTDPRAFFEYYAGNLILETV